MPGAPGGPANDVHGTTLAESGRGKSEGLARTGRRMEFPGARRRGAAGRWSPGCKVQGTACARPLSFSQTLQQGPAQSSSFVLTSGPAVVRREPQGNPTLSWAATPTLTPASWLCRIKSCNLRTTRVRAPGNRKRVGVGNVPSVEKTRKGGEVVLPTASPGPPPRDSRRAHPQHCCTDLAHSTGWGGCLVLGRSLRSPPTAQTRRRPVPGASCPCVSHSPGPCRPPPGLSAERNLGQTQRPQQPPQVRTHLRPPLLSGG